MMEVLVSSPDATVTSGRRRRTVAMAERKKLDMAGLSLNELNERD
jgi:hypothetical protein